MRDSRYVSSEKGQETRRRAGLGKTRLHFCVDPSPAPSAEAEAPVINPDRAKELLLVRTLHDKFNFRIIH
jgi:hypothetical protein